MKTVEVFKGKGQYLGKDTGLDLVWANYESVSDIEEDKVYSQNEGDWYRQQGYTGSDWWGWHDGYQGLLNRMRDGWKDGAERMVNELSHIELPPVRSVKRRRVRGAYGDHIDMQRVYSGSLDTAWERTQRYRANSIGSNNAIIMVDVKTAAMVKGSQAFWRGACAAMIADTLQKSGRNVKVVVTSTMDGVWHRDKTQFVWTATVKDFEQPMDLETMAVMTSVGFYRGHGFKIAHCQGRRSSYSLGDNVFRTKMVTPPNFVSDNTLVINVEFDILSKQQAEDKLKSVVQKLAEDLAA